MSVGESRQAVAARATAGLGRRGGLRARRQLVSLWHTVRTLALLAVAWELFGRSGVLHNALFPPFSEAVGRLVEWARQGLFWRDLGWSLYRLAAGLLLGSAAGTLLGMVMGYSRSVESWVVPALDLFLSIPSIAVYPVVILAFGLSNKAIIYTLAFEVAITVTVNTWTGVKSVPPVLVNAARTMGARGRVLFWRVMLPGALAHIISGYRLAFSRAWRILVAAELMGGVGSGLGFRIQEGRAFFDSELVFAGVLALGVLGVLAERLLLRVLEEATVERWGLLRS
ncbi:MAG TPA: ABC transporter permease [Limnochordales bacterium]